MEGTACYNPSSGCDTTGLTMPVIDYTHDFGIAVVGGYVYHGAHRPDLRGDYIYADYGSGRIWMLRYEGGQVISSAELLHSPYVLSSFGVDQNDELYIMSYSTSGDTPILRFADLLASVGSQKPESVVPQVAELEQNYPNPFNPKTVISGQWTVDTRVRLVVCDLLGREVAILADGRYQAGRHQFTFDGSNLASGVYFCRLTAGKYTEVMPMLLEK
jgi:hypothetical protein